MQRKGALLFGVAMGQVSCSADLVKSAGKQNPRPTAFCRINSGGGSFLGSLEPCHVAVSLLGTVWLRCLARRNHPQKNTIPCSPCPHTTILHPSAPEVFPSHQQSTCSAAQAPSALLKHPLSAHLDPNTPSADHRDLISRHKSRHKSS